jgi:hypothetical protein
VTAFVLTHQPKGSLQATAQPDFGTVKVGTTATAAVAVKNTGNADTGLTARLSGDTAFAVGKNSCTGKLRKGGSCEVDVIFTPGAVGAKQATLLLHPDNAPDPGPIAFKGAGGLGALTFSPSPAVFAINRPSPFPFPGSTADPITITLGNSGSEPLLIKGMQIQQTVPYTQFGSSNCTPGTRLEPGQSCSVLLTFNFLIGFPAIPFDQNTTILVDTDLPGSPSREPIHAVAG